MKIFKPTDYPIFLTDDHIADLIAMKNTPQYQQNWESIKASLSKEDVDFIERKEKQLERKRSREQYLASLSDEEKAALAKEFIRPRDFPIEMNTRNVEILANMMSHFPPLQEWRDISELITYEQRNLIRERIKERKDLREQQRWNALSPEEQAKEKKEEEESLKEGPGVYRGNILQQEWDSMALEEIERKKREQQDKEDLDK
jgi:hypothetical protein